MVRAVARRSLAAFRISSALGSSTGATAGAGAFFDALAGLAAGGAGGDCWAYPLVARHTPSASNSVYLRDLSRIIMPPDAQCHYRRHPSWDHAACIHWASAVLPGGRTGSR